MDEGNRGDRVKRRTSLRWELLPEDLSERSQAHRTCSLTRLLQPAGLWQTEGAEGGTLSRTVSRGKERWQSLRQKVLRPGPTVWHIRSGQMLKCPEKKLLLPKEPLSIRLETPVWFLEV